MFGWRARIGTLISAPNTVFEPELYAMAPAGVSIHTARLKRGQVMSGSMEEDYAMAAQLEEAAKSLAVAKVDAIIYGCTGGSLLEGPGYDQELTDKISQAAGVPATTTSSAVLAALRRLGARSVCVLTPYPRGIDEREERFLEGNGVRVVQIRGLGLQTLDDVASYPPELIYRAARQLRWSEGDVFFISCTNFPAIPCIATLEQDFGRPVITSNQASLWAVLDMLSIRAPIAGYGQLLEQCLAGAPGAVPPPELATA